MGIEWFRDLSIVILGFVTTAALIFAAVLVYRLYSTIKPTLLLVKGTSKITHDNITLAQEVIKPLLPTLAVIQVIRDEFEGISKIFKKESNEGKNANK